MALKPGQEKCINTLDRSLVVAAGAGSGKTFTLTKRIVHAIQSGAVDGIERVCAITFTNKAAGELKSRIKAELRACGLADQALAVDEAWVSTIHGACARILRAHAIELGVDPAFAMADSSIDVMRARAIDQVLHEARAEARTSFPQMGEALDALFAEYPARSQGLRGNSVESMLRRLIDLAGANANGFDSLVVPKAAVNPAALATFAIEAYEELADAARAQKPSEKRMAWIAAMDERIPAIRSGLEGGRAADAAWVLEALDHLPAPQRVGTAEYKERVAHALEQYRASVASLRLAMAAPHLNTLVELAKRAFERFSDMKRAAGVLDNDDLLVGAYHALTEHPDIAALYADKFQLVMVDEFQDTDQMQVDMIKQIAGPDACRLCVVGDAQQSIYRFRGADVSVYRRHLDQVKARSAEDVILLPDNFRSHADVLSLVDRVFEVPDMFGGEFMSLAPGRDEAQVRTPLAAGLPRVQVQLTSNAYRGASTSEVRQVAATRLADALADMHARGHSAGDMAVLLGGMTNAQVYADALRARGLACVISGGSVFASTLEARTVLDLARVAANPYQTEALYNVLVGPAFALCATDMLELATCADGRDGGLQRMDICTGLRRRALELAEAGPNPSWSSQLASALRVMGAFLDGVGAMAVSRLTMRLALDSGWLARCEARGAEGLAQAANIYKAIRMLEDLERSSGAGPARLAKLFCDTLGSSKEAPGALSASGGDFVRIMTVHASKGLEFPIVAVAEFKDGAPHLAPLLANGLGGKVYLSLDLQNTPAALQGPAKLPDVSSLYASVTQGAADESDLERMAVSAEDALSLRAALSQYDKLGDSEEAKRLLYVALTRAKEALIVSCMGKRTKDNPNAMPTSCMGAVVRALAGDEGCEPGSSFRDFGGSLPARVEHLALDADGRPCAGEDAGEGSGQALKPAVPAELGEPSRLHGGLGALAAAPGERELCEGGRPLDAQAPATARPDAACTEAARPAVVRSDGAQGFLVAEPVGAPAIERVPYAPGREGVFSYSSISEAVHGTPLLDQLASRFFVAAEGVPAESGAGSALPESPEEGAASRAGLGFDPAFGSAGFAVDAADDEGGFWDFGEALASDDDKATDFGTAFHRLAQYAVVTRSPEGQLSMPPQERIDAFVRAGMLDDVQRARLGDALSRWFGSSVAQAMQGRAALAPELPFFVALQGPCEADRPSGVRQGAVYLEGEIDLFAAEGDAAYVVDYKTGGRDDEGADDLSRKHVLQASCYAYAVLRQGFASVDASFVRVERPSASEPLEPQCIRYHFEAADIELLESSIAAAYAMNQGHDE